MGAPDPPRPRTCCMLSAGLASNDDGVGSDRNLVDPSDLGHHTQSTSGLTGAGGGKTGIMYSKQLGFLDLGHLRDMADLTKYVHERLLDGCAGAASRRAAGTPGTCTFNASTRIPTTHGHAEITAALADADLLPVAQSIAFDDSVGYEIYTYWKFEIGGHNSSFSPEDLPSNYLGTWVGAEAIKRTWASKRNYEDEVDSVLSELCRKADAQPKATTKQVLYDYVKGKWVHKTASVASDKYLLRRNFTGDYWDAFIDAPIAHLDASGAAQGYATGKSLDSYASKYRFTFDADKKDPFTRTDFPARIDRIRKHATDPAQYGPNYDSPSDPSFPLPKPPSAPPAWHPAPAPGMSRPLPPPPVPPPSVPIQPLGMNTDDPADEEQPVVAALDDTQSDSDNSLTPSQDEETQVATADDATEEAPVAEQDETSDSDDDALAANDDSSDAENPEPEDEEIVAESQPEEDEDESLAETEPEEEESDAGVA